MRREREPEELIACWTLVEDDWRLVGNKTGATRLGFAVLLKFFELEARFPRGPGEVPPAALQYLARQLGRAVRTISKSAGGNGNRNRNRRRRLSLVSARGRAAVQD